MVGSGAQQIKQNIPRLERGKERVQEGHSQAGKEASHKSRGAGPRQTEGAPGALPAHRDAILLAGVVELLPHLASPGLALLLLAAVFLPQLLALGNLLLQ